jgi:hypothetical protein
VINLFDDVRFVVALAVLGLLSFCGACAVDAPEPEDDTYEAWVYCEELWTCDPDAAQARCNGKAELDMSTPACVETPPTQEDVYDVIAACLLTCFNKWAEGCPAMDTIAERQVCYDACNAVPATVPAQCEDEYIALQHCRGDRLDSYYCRNGEAVSRWSCLTDQIQLGLCRQQNQ